MLLNEVCAEIRNYFTYRNDILIGDYKIEGGVIAPLIDYKGCEYIRIIGSRKNNGVHKLNEETGLFDLEDEDTFHGSIWRMSPPKDFLLLVGDIEKWQKKYGGIESENMSPFQSESFGGYAYSKSSRSTAMSSSSGTPTSWVDAFSSRLKMYRRIRVQ